MKRKLPSPKSPPIFKQVPDDLSDSDTELIEIPLALVIPDEILVDIFKLLPVESLRIVEQVCTYWNEGNLDYFNLI